MKSAKGVIVINIKLFLCTQYIFLPELQVCKRNPNKPYIITFGFRTWLVKKILEKAKFLSKLSKA